MESSTKQCSLYCVPFPQPLPETAEAKKYGGAHMTLFPSQKIHANFDLNAVMSRFAMTSTPWNLKLPGITTSIVEAKSKNLVLLMVHNANTINALRKFMEKPENGGWVKPWSSNHTTLGEINPHDQYKPEQITSIDTWYVQLVNHTGEHWPTSQRVQLYVAQGLHN